MRRVVSGFVVLAVLWGWGTVAGAFECPTRIEEAALDKAKAAAKAASHAGEAAPRVRHGSPGA